MSPPISLRTVHRLPCSARHAAGRSPSLRGLRSSLLLIAGLSLAVGGCASAPPAPTAPPREPAPVFADDQAALTAAESALKKYLSAEAIVAANGGAGINQLRTLSTPSHHQDDIEAFAEFRSTGKKRVGEPQLLSVTLQQRYEAARIATVITYVCVDYSGTHLFDAEGNDISPGYFTTPALFTAELRSSTESEKRLLIHSTNYEGSSDECEA